MKNAEKKRAKLRKSYKRVYEKCILKAKKIVPDKKKISQKIKKARKIFERLHNIPRCDTLSKHICNFCDLLSDYLDGTYTNLPLATFVALIAGILYLVLPFDITYLQAFCKPSCIFSTWKKTELLVRSLWFTPIV